MHKKTKTTINVGDTINCGSRKLTLDEIDGNVLDVTLTIKKGETVEIRDPRQRDNSWVLDDPGEGTMINSKHSVTIGHKIRIGNYRQFRIVQEDDILSVVIIGPE